MRKIFLFLLALPLFATPPVVSNIQFLYGSHSSVTVEFDVSAGGNNDFRVRYIPTTQGSCDAGNAAATLETFGLSGLDDNSTTSLQIPVSGLAPNTEYEFCPEVSNDSGTTWSTTGGANPSGATYTTLPDPTVHPALPIHPATFNTAYPDTTQGTCWSNSAHGYCVQTTAANCSDLNGDISSAIQHQNTGGTVIEIPAGSVCTTPLTWAQISPDAIAYNPSDIASNEIHLAAHGLSEGQGVMFSGQEMSSGGVYYPAPPSGLVAGYIYFVHVVDADHFELYQHWQQETGSETSGSASVVLDRLAGWASSPGISVGEEIVGSGIPSGTTISSIDYNAKTLTLSQAATASASNVTFTFGGPLQNIGPCTQWCTSNGGIAHFVPWPRSSLYWVIVRTSTPDSQFAPVGTRVNPAWVPKMAVLESTTGSAMLSMYDYASHIRFTGIEWTYQPTTEVASNPTAHETLINVWDSNSDIVFDRNGFHGPGGRDDRIHKMIWFNGMNVAIIDSYWDKLEYWHASYDWPGRVGSSNESSQTPSGTAGTASFTVPQTTVYYGAPNPATLSSTLTVSWTGTPDTSITTPEIAVYFDMTGGLNIVAPQGLSVTASAGNVFYTTTSGNGSCTQGDALIPKDANGNEAAAPLGCASIASDGTLSSDPVAGHVDHGIDTEGCQCFIGGIGPGPYQLSNNYISGSGILVHFDDSGGRRWRGDYLIRRNTFHVPMTDLDIGGNTYAEQAGIPSDGYWHAERQVLEWKGGERAWIDGNIFDGGFADVNHGDAFDFTAHTGSTYGSTDVDVTNNTVQHYPAGMGNTIMNEMDNSGTNPPFTSKRYRVFNNLSWDINGWVYSTSSWVGWGVGAIGVGGYVGSSWGPNEDVIFDHNTIDDMNGMMGGFWDSTNGGGGASQPSEGVSITNNIIPYVFGPTQQDLFMKVDAGLNSSACTGNITNEAGANCGFIAGVGNPDLVFAGNLLIPGWAKSQYPEGGTQISVATIQSDWPDYYAKNTIMTDTGTLAALGAVGWQDRVIQREWDSDGNYIGPKPNFRLLSSSLYNCCETTDGLQEGANINALEVAQGKVTLVGANQITSTSANITYIAPDAAACYVDYDSSDPTLIDSFTRVEDAGGNRLRNVPLSGLTANTKYYVRVNCSVQQPTTSFTTAAQ